MRAIKQETFPSSPTSISAARKKKKKKQPSRNASSNLPHSEMKAPRSMWRLKAGGSEHAHTAASEEDGSCHSSSTYATVSPNSPQASCARCSRSGTFFNTHSKNRRELGSTNTFNSTNISTTTTKQKKIISCHFHQY